MSKSTEYRIISRRFPVLFNIVRFSNDACNASDSDTGICYTHAECDQRGGAQARPCAAGFGVCCLCKIIFSLIILCGLYFFPVRANGLQDDMRVGSEKMSYFSNPAWPANDSTLQFATHTIRIEDEDVCQVSS